MSPSITRGPYGPYSHGARGQGAADLDVTANPLSDVKCALWNDTANWNTQVPPLLLSIVRPVVLAPISYTNVVGASTWLQPFAFPEQSDNAPYNQARQYVYGQGAAGRLFLAYPGLWRIGCFTTPFVTGDVTFAIIDAPDSDHANGLLLPTGCGQAFSLNIAIPASGTAPAFTLAQMILNQTVAVHVSCIATMRATWAQAAATGFTMLANTNVTLSGPTLPLSGLTFTNPVAAATTGIVTLYGRRY